MNQDELARRLASWFEMCVVVWSPWIHFRENKYKVVDQVRLCFSDDISEELKRSISKAIDKLQYVNVEDTSCTFDRKRYETWESMFTFEWEELTFCVNKDFAYFEDLDGNQSRYLFDMDLDLDKCGPTYFVPHKKPEIPWLLCTS